MTAPLDPGLIGVALEVEMGDLPEEVRLDVTSIFERRETGLVWNDIPGVLCAVTLYYSGSSSSWSPLHGYFNADLEKFETDFPRSCSRASPARSSGFTFRGPDHSPSSVGSGCEGLLSWRCTRSCSRPRSSSPSSTGSGWTSWSPGPTRRCCPSSSCNRAGCSR